MLLTVTFYPLKMAKIVFLNTFKPNRPTKHNLGDERTFLVAKIFYISPCKGRLPLLVADGHWPAANNATINLLSFACCKQKKSHIKAKYLIDALVKQVQRFCLTNY